MQFDVRPSFRVMTTTPPLPNVVVTRRLRGTPVPMRLCFENVKKGGKKNPHYLMILSSRLRQNHMVWERQLWQSGANGGYLPELLVLPVFNET